MKDTKTAIAIRGVFFQRASMPIYDSKDAAAITVKTVNTEPDAAEGINGMICINLHMIKNGGGLAATTRTRATICRIASCVNRPQYSDSTR